jgi:hypothetical protein
MTDQFVASTASLYDSDELASIHETQLRALKHLHGANTMMSSLGEYAQAQMATLGPELARHTRALRQLKKDMDAVFKRIRELRARMQKAQQSGSGGAPERTESIDEDFLHQ